MTSGFSQNVYLNTVTKTLEGGHRTRILIATLTPGKSLNLSGPSLTRVEGVGPCYLWRLLDAILGWLKWQSCFCRQGWEKIIACFSPSYNVLLKFWVCIIETSFHVVLVLVAIGVNFGLAQMKTAILLAIAISPLCNIHSVM